MKYIVNTKNIVNLEAYIRAYICFGLVIHGDNNKTDNRVGENNRFIKGDGVTRILSPNRNEE